MYTLRSSKRQEAEDTVQLSQTRFLSTLFALEVNPPSRRHTTCSCSLPLQLKRRRRRRKGGPWKVGMNEEGRKEGDNDGRGGSLKLRLCTPRNKHTFDWVRPSSSSLYLFSIWVVVKNKRTGGLFYLMNTRRKGKEERSWWRFNASLLALVRAGAGKQGTRFACHSLNRLLRLRPTCVWVWK